MKLILSRENPDNQMLIVYSIPNLNISDEIQENLRILHGKFRESEISTEYLHKDFGPYSAYYFKVKSAYFDTIEIPVMITLYFEQHENIKFFLPTIEKTIKEFKNIPDLTKAFYITTPHADAEAFTIFGKMTRILTECFFEASKIHSTYNLGLAEILVLGNKGSGKTSIVEYLINGRFIHPDSPTLSPQIMKLIFEKIDYRVLDVCCTAHVKEVLEEHPLELGKLPQSIVYVIDASLQGEKLENAKKEFDEWMEYLSRIYPKEQFKNIPILILYNKIDKNPDFDEEKFNNLFDILKYNTNNKYDKVSALSGIGLKDNFSWIISHIKIASKI